MKRWILLVTVALTLCSTELALAQSAEPWTITIRGTAGAPTGALGDLFNTGAGGTLGVGRRVSSEVLWEGILDVARFDRPNVKALYHDSLSMSLEWAGAGVQASYYPFGGEGVVNGLLHPYLTGGALMARWTYDRGRMAADSTGITVIPAFSQQDWSLSLSAGLGCEAFAAEWVSFYAQASYRLVIGEIWPTLALRLEGASGFQLAEASAGIRVWW